jgi:hypothetical protein
MKTVFVASSRRYYPQVKAIKTRLDALGVKGFYPYFEYHDDRAEIDESIKKKLTMGYFPELDQIDALYIYAQDGYAGMSVAIETAYAYALGKEIISSEPINELALRAIVSKVMSIDEFIAYASKN